MKVLFPQLKSEIDETTRAIYPQVNLTAALKIWIFAGAAFWRRLFEGYP